MNNSQPTLADRRHLTALIGSGLEIAGNVCRQSTEPQPAMREVGTASGRIEDGHNGAAVAGAGNIRQHKKQGKHH